jgi:hypothetical protein
MTLESVRFSEDPIDVPDADEVPDQVREFVPTPPPGAGYVLQFPGKDGFGMSEFETTEGPDKKPCKRVKVLFGMGEGEPLTIAGVPMDVDEAQIGQPFRWAVTNVGRNRARRGQPTLLVSEMYYLLKALGTPPQKGWTNKQYAEAMLKLANKYVMSTIEWNAYCNPKKAIWVSGEEGKLVEVPEQMGCGKGLYQKDFAKAPKGEDGSWQRFIKCPNCPAVLRANTGLTAFQKYEV